MCVYVCVCECVRVCCCDHRWSTERVFAHDRDNRTHVRALFCYSRCSRAPFAISVCLRRTAMHVKICAAHAFTLRECVVACCNLAVRATRIGFVGRRIALALFINNTMRFRYTQHTTQSSCVCVSACVIDATLWRAGLSMRSDR